MSNTDNLPKGEMDAAEARAIACRALRFADRVVAMAEEVLLATPREVAVAVFVEDKPADAPALKGKAAPRGRVHPLLALIRAGLGATRLVKDFVRRLFPQVMGESEEAVGATVSSFENLVNDLRGLANEMGMDPDAA